MKWQSAHFILWRSVESEIFVHLQIIINHLIDESLFRYKRFSTVNGAYTKSWYQGVFFGLRTLLCVPTFSSTLKKIKQDKKLQLD